MKKFSIGVDLGGTNLRVGLVNSSGMMIRIQSFPVGSDKSEKGIVKAIKESILNVATHQRNNIRGVGIGAPGIVDSKKGVIIKSPHYPEWRDFPLRREVARALKLPVELDNDANFIAAGEAWKGAGKKFKSFIMLTLGTGIGGGIIVNRKIFHGDSGFAGEIGHMVIDFNGEICDCGGRGCWENYVSIGGLQWFIKMSNDPAKDKLLEKFNGEIDKVTPKRLFEFAKDGDYFALAMWKKFGAYLGAGIASLINVTGMFNYVIGGGISNAWELFIDEANREMSRRTYKESVERTTIVRATLGDSAGILGAVSSLSK